MILYVEDNPNNQRLLQRIVEARGIPVMLADSAEDGLAAVKTHHPYLILVDLHLKTRHTGLDLVHWLRAFRRRLSL